MNAFDIGFESGMEKVAVSPDWIRGKLQGMATKVRNIGERNLHLGERVHLPSPVLNKLNDRHASMVTDAMMARPSSPKTISTMAAKSKLGDKIRAMEGGRESIYHAAYNR